MTLSEDFFNNRIVADFHIHSPYSAATSKDISLPAIQYQANKVGLNLVGTGDIFHPIWLKYLQSALTKLEEGIYKLSKENPVSFILTGEVEDKESVHHLIFLPSFEETKSVLKLLNKATQSKAKFQLGRPKVHLSAKEIAEIVYENNGMIGPAHAFTPFRSIFRENRYNSIQDCYGNYASKVDFIELGLSANTHMADKIGELWRYTYISNSDSHSLLPGKLGRECNVIHLSELNFYNLSSAFRKKHEQRVMLNIGLDPRLGKYYLSFCYKCRRRVVFAEIPKMQYNNQFIEFPIRDKDSILIKIKNKKLRCPVCNGILKLGVNDRIEFLKTTDKKNPLRPPYYNIIPLSDIIQLVFNIKSNKTKRFSDIYDTIIKRYKNELHFLLQVEIKQIFTFNQKLGTIIKKIRNQSTQIIAGGGGIYGSLII
ncbi:MAG: endonuclease Q family protein [Candidatus Heimdallarchaeaceae archaeon]